MVKVRIERYIFNAPTRKRTFFLRLNRDLLYLSKDDVYTDVKDIDTITKYLAEGRAHKGLYLFLENSGIVCDGCGDPIFKQYVDILVIDGYGWGAICDKCREKYHKKLPIYVFIKNK